MMKKMKNLCLLMKKLGDYIKLSLFKLGWGKITNTKPRGELKKENYKKQKNSHFLGNFLSFFNFCEIFLIISTIYCVFV